MDWQNHESFNDPLIIIRHHAATSKRWRTLLPAHEILSAPQRVFLRAGAIDMAINADYAIPVQVNGYSCKNCTDVGYAKKHIDPAHPKSGPYGVNAAADPSRVNEAVLFGANLARSRSTSTTAPMPKALGTFLDISA